jgi:hypothetical protein
LIIAIDRCVADIYDSVYTLSIRRICGLDFFGSSLYMEVRGIFLVIFEGADMSNWNKRQLQAFIDKYGLVAGPVIFRLLKTIAARGRRY